MNLKLAEYNLKTGKFERFLDLAEGYIDTDCSTVDLGKYRDFYDGGFLLGKNAIRIIDLFDKYDFDIYLKDEKDPLNRFNGLFNGRTYGEGKFILITEKIELSIFN